MTEAELKALVRKTLDRLHEYVAEVRNDWSDFDGRQNRSIINDIVAELENAVGYGDDAPTP